MKISKYTYFSEFQSVQLLFKSVLYWCGYSKQKKHVHCDFIESWKNFKVNFTHPGYKQLFKSCVVNNDSHHISYKGPFTN